MHDGHRKAVMWIKASRPLGFAVLMLALLNLGGCGGGLVVRVDSIVAEGAGMAGSYHLRSGMEKVAEDDLHFQEFSAYVHAALKQQGYRPADAATQADLDLYFSYGDTLGETHYYTATTPIYDWVGGETVYYSETRTDESGKVTRKEGATTLPLRHRAVGVEQTTYSFTPHTVYAIVEAREGVDNRPVWKTSISSTGPARDLRAIMPLLIRVATPYFGRNTGGLIGLKITDNELRAQGLKPAGP